LEESAFCDQLAKTNSLDIQEWLFYPGMLFGSTKTWWSASSDRKSGHEGIDLCYFRTSSGTRGSLPGGALIPVLFDGTIVHTISDFIGKTMFVRHSWIRDGNNELYTVYGHVLPLAPSPSADTVGAGNIIAAISAIDRPVRGMLPHLHLSCAWIERSVSPDHLDWDMMKRGPLNRLIRLIDPLPLIRGNYTVLQDQGTE